MELLFLPGGAEVKSGDWKNEVSGCVVSEWLRWRDLPFVWEMPLVKLQSILSSLFVALAACCPCLVQVRCVFSGLFPIKLEFRRSDIRPRVLRVLSLARQRCRARLRRGHLLDENRGRRSDR